ncbi:MAG: hypothetical protein QOJ73_4397 [Streptosporangiaceae bacterium]|nr:hypothetical protein [Streptosporangiaceae bacterium]
MFANRRFAVPVLLAASLGAGTVIGVAGCGGSSPRAAPVTTSAAPPAAATPSESEQPKISPAALQNVVSCMKSHGVTFSAATVTAKEVKGAFRALSVTRQQSVFAACGPALPANIRQAVQQRMAQETASAAASP